MPTSFGERLAEQRTKFGFSQIALCELTSVNRRTQYHYESGKSFPDSRYLTTLIQYGFDIIYLLTGEESPKREMIDETFLRDVMVAVEEAAALQPPFLSPIQKASISATMFQVSFNSKTIDKNILGRLIRLAHLT